MADNSQKDPAMSKPSFADAPDMKAAYAWLKTNGVDEWIPENPTIVVDRNAQTITYDAFQWDGKRGWDGDNLRIVNDDVAREKRTVPLKNEPDAEVIAAASRAGATLTVVG